MSSKTKIVVLHLKELIYTGIFIVLGILFIILLFIMFRSDQDETKSPAVPETEEGEDAPVAPTYQSGVYKSAIYLEGDTIEIGLTIEDGQIASLTMEPVSDKISNLYPLLEPSFDSISKQICEGQPLDNITYEEEATYTSQLLLSVIGDTLAKIQTEE